MNAFGLYARYVGVSFRSQMQYKASFLLSSFGAFLVSFVEVLGIWALFDRFGGLSGWTLPQVCLFYGFVNMTFAVADAVSLGFDTFGAQYVKSGDLDRLLLRPRSLALQLLGHELTLRRVGRFAQGAIVFGWAVSALDIAWSPASVGLLVFAFTGGVAMFVGLFVFAAFLSFWTVESLELMNTMTYGGVETAQYPLSIYERHFRAFFTFVVPLACVAYFPLVAVLGIEDPLGTSYLFQAAAPIAGMAFLAMALALFRYVGLRHYTSTGS